MDRVRTLVVSQLRAAALDWAPEQRASFTKKHGLEIEAYLDEIESGSPEGDRFFEALIDSAVTKYSSDNAYDKVD